MSELIPILDDYPALKGLFILLALLIALSQLPWHWLRWLSRRLGRYTLRPRREWEEMARRLEKSRRELEWTRARLEELDELIKEALTEADGNLQRKEEVFTALYAAVYETNHGLGMPGGTVAESYPFFLNVIQDTFRNHRTGLPRVNIFVPDPEDGRFLMPRVMAGHTSRGKRNRVEIQPHTAAGYTYLRGESYLDNDTSRPESRLKPNPNAARPVRSILCVPVPWGGRVIGVLSVAGEGTEAFSGDDRFYLEMFAGIVAPLLVHDLAEGGWQVESIGSTVMAANEVAAGTGPQGGTQHAGVSQARPKRPLRS